LIGPNVDAVGWLSCRPVWKIISPLSARFKIASLGGGALIVEAIRQRMERHRHPEAVAAAVRALVKTQKALKADVSLATKVGRKLFPVSEAELIADVVERDLPFYDPAISREFVAGMTEFQRHMGLLSGDVSYDDIVATKYSQYWTS